VTPAVLSVLADRPEKMGGPESFAAEVSRQLGERGWRSVLCFECEPSPQVREALQAPNVEFDLFEDPHSNRPAAVRRFWQLLRRHRPSIVHFQFVGPIGPHPWLSAAAGAKRVFFTDQTSRPASCAGRRAPAWKRAAARAITQPVTEVLAVSDYVARSVAAVGLVREQRVARLYNGVDLRRVDATADAGAAFRERHGIPRDALLVVQVGSMTAEKGVNDFVAAAAVTAAQRPEAHFALVGEGACRAEYTELATRLGIADRITWTGVVADPIAAGVYAAADVVCLLSRWEEACAFVLTEAMGHARPVVATRVGGTPELVADGETGLLVGAGDPAAAATAIDRLLGDPQLRVRMGQAGRLAAETKFDLRKNVAVLLDRYRIA
jgi:glycosyltransferase involved in cell wall biosynthesis